MIERVIPFFEASPLLSSKRMDFEKFASVVRAMAAGHHRSSEGFIELLELAVSMNGNGRFRQHQWLEIIRSQPESSETVRQTGGCIRKIQSELHGDMQSQAEMT